MFAYPDSTTVNERLEAQEYTAKIIDILVSCIKVSGKIAPLLDLLKEIDERCREEDVGLKSALLHLNAALYNSRVKLPKTDLKTLVTTEQGVSLIMGLAVQGSGVNSDVEDYIKSGEAWEFVPASKEALYKLATVLRNKEVK